MANLAVTYRPQKFEDLTEQSVIAKMLESICTTEPLDCRNFLLIGPAGCGKAQPMYSQILTPDGYIQMKDVTIGTQVFTAKGNLATISEIYPQGERDIYEIKLQDGTSIRVADNHLNVVYRYNEDRRCREDFTLETTELIELFNESRFRLRMDIPKVDWVAQPVPIDPYLLGALIGDGALSSNNLGFSNSELDVVTNVDNILRRDWGCRLLKLPGDNVDYSIVPVDSRKYIFYLDGKDYNRPDMIDKLESMGYPRFDEDTLIRICNGNARYYNKKYPDLQSKLKMVVNPNYSTNSLRLAIKSLNLDVPSKHKHIPKIYLYNSAQIRTKLLQGLYDTDGYSSGRSTEFCTSSAQLSADFAFLVRSLGARDTVSESVGKYKKDVETKYCSKSYLHSFKFCNGFDYYTSSKHSNRVPTYQHNPMRNIQSITYVGKEECQCIMVDHPDHTYISDGFIPTHNTTSARIMANLLNQGHGEPIEIDAASHNGIDSIREIIQQARSYPVGCAWKIFIIDEVHSLSNQAWQAMLKTLEENPAKSVFIMCTTNPEKIPQTILSRVQTFQLSKISLTGIENRLKYVIDQENSKGNCITYTDDAINYIAKLAQGGMRDALTLLDKTLAYSKDINSVNLAKSLNLPKYDDFFSLLTAYVKHNNQQITEIVLQVYNSGINFVKWFAEFHSFVINIVKYIYLQDINQTMIPAHYADRIKNYTTKHSAICLKLSNKLIKLNTELKSTQYLQEMALTYLCSVPSKE